MAMTSNLRKRIAKANKYIRWARKNDVWGTLKGVKVRGYPPPFLAEYTHEIQTSPAENIVTVRYLDLDVRDPGAGSDDPWADAAEDYQGSYDVRDAEEVTELRYEISTFIIKAIKNGARDAGLKVPAYK